MLDVKKFEKKVISGIESCGIDSFLVSPKSPVGIAVSGGADSVSLLLSLSSIFEPACLRVITVDHGIRSKEESGGDALFVKKLCENLGLSCYIEEIASGKIEELSKKSALSVEAVARKLRYEIFDSFIKKQNLLALCLAHNQNDQCETLIMRFLQGSGTEGMGGIEKTRGKFIRPLLEISRSEIEDYLRQKNQAWCTDSTNADTSYLRNRIRNILVPVLDENFCGWKKAVLSGAKKASCDEDFFQNVVKSISKTVVFPADEECVSECQIKISRNSFYSSHYAVRRRVFFAALNKIGWGGRFPFRVFEEIASWKDVKFQKISFEEIEVSVDSENLVIQVSDGEKNAGEKTSLMESGFCFLLKKIGDKIEFDNLLVCAENPEKNKVPSVEEKSPGFHNCNLSFISKNPADEKISFAACFPLLVRSPVPGDEVKTSGAGLKSLSSIFNDWKIPENQRDKILVVEELCPCSDNSLKAVLGFHLGFKNWIVE